MMKTPYIKRTLLSAAMTVAASAVLASDQSTSPISDGQTIHDIVPSYDSIRRLPIDGVQMVEIDGRTIFTSSNGRFVFMNAELYDTWSRKRLRSAAEIADYISRIDLEALRIKPDMLGAMTVGSGEQRVTVFVDPQCPYCADMLKDMLHKDMQERYTFNVVMIPILGEESGSITRNLHCAYANKKMTAYEVVKALAKKDYAKVEPASKVCDDGAVQRAIVSAKMFGANGVPFVISPSGRYVNHVPPDLDKFLETGIL